MGYVSESSTGQVKSSPGLVYKSNFIIIISAGQERFRSLIPSYIRDSSVAIVVYDVTSKTKRLFKCHELFNWIGYWISILSIWIGYLRITEQTRVLLSLYHLSLPVIIHHSFPLN